MQSFKSFPKLSVILGTSIVGSGEIVIALSFYAGSLPELFPVTNTKHGGLSPITALFIFYQFQMTLMTLLGTWYQSKNFERFHKDNVFKIIYGD